LFSKSLTYILTAPWPSQLADWYCWAVLFAFVATGGYWIHSTAVALRKFNAGLVMSVMQVGHMGGIVLWCFWKDGEQIVEGSSSV
jgi:hypothetical protein